MRPSRTSRTAPALMWVPSSTARRQCRQGLGQSLLQDLGENRGRRRYYTCSIKARQGETGCKGRSIPMEKLDNLVAGHLEDRLLQPERLEEILTSVLDRRQRRAADRFPASS